MTRTEFRKAYRAATVLQPPGLYVGVPFPGECRDVEHVTLQTGGSWGSAVGAYVGGEHTAPIPFTGWAGA